MEYKYKFLAYKQSSHDDANTILSFVASSNEIAEWSGVPRRTDQLLTGFQRVDDPKRVERAKEFFKKPFNQSPTSLLVGFMKESIGINIEFDDNVIDDKIDLKTGTLTIEMDEEQNIEFLSENIVNSIDKRLALISDEDSETDENDDSDEDKDDSDEDNEDADDEDSETIEVGKSLLKELRTKLSDLDWCKENEVDLREIAKPGFLIDGQHRLEGAASLERDLPFTVNAICDCDWAEQVFQFTVINYTQKGIPDKFITANASMSLTKNELDSYSGRLEQAGIKVLEYIIMETVNFDERSPFKDLIDLSEKSSDNKIGYKTMVKIAKCWFAPSKKSTPALHNQILPKLYPELRTVNERKDKWQSSGDWTHFFLAFWKKVYVNYKDHASHIDGKLLWDVGYSNLMVAVVLEHFQKHFLINLNAQDDSYFNVSANNQVQDMIKKIESRTEKFVEFFSPEFFKTKWEGGKSLNSTPGKKRLDKCFSELVTNKGDYRYNSDSLITDN